MELICQTLSCEFFWVYDGPEAVWFRNFSPQNPCSPCYVGWALCSVLYCVSFFLFTQLLEGSDAAVWACAILGLLAWWFARDADKGLPIEIFRKKASRDEELTKLDGELPLPSSVVIRVITSKLAIPIGLAIAVGVSMLLWDFDGNIRRRSGFFHALISVFGQEGVAIV